MRDNWYGIPGKWITDPTAPDGKRFVSTLYGWRIVRVTLVDTCKNKCESCGNHTEHGDLHHVYGRGAGGGKREDRPVVWFGNELVRMVVYLCRECHEKTAIKSWGSWAWREDVTTSSIQDTVSDGSTGHLIAGTVTAE